MTCYPADCTQCNHCHPVRSNHHAQGLTQAPLDRDHRRRADRQRIHLPTGEGRPRSTLIARPGSQRLAQLERYGGIMLTTGERVEATISDRLDEQRPYDVVIVTVLAHQVDSVLPALARSIAGCVILMLATPEAERLRAAIGADRTQFGFAGVLATLDADGKLNVTIQRAKAILEDQRWVDLFRDAGMPANWILTPVQTCARVPR